MISKNMILPQVSKKAPFGPSLELKINENKIKIKKELYPR
jgi:hypothetical protein